METLLGDCGILHAGSIQMTKSRIRIYMFERKLLAASWETRAGMGAGHSQCGWQGILNTCLRVDGTSWGGGMGSLGRSMSTQPVVSESH